MEELIVDIHVLVVDGAVECDGDHHGQLAQLQLAALHAWQNKKNCEQRRHYEAFLILQVDNNEK